MPKLDAIVYSRDATIKAVRDYYAFLTTMYLNEDAIATPPEEGWPSISGADRSRLAELGKSDEVLSLLAHLPYLRSDGDQNYLAHGTFDSYFADWREMIGGLVEGKSTGDGLKMITEKYYLYDISPPHIISLTTGSYDVPLFVLDTKFGVISWPNCPDGIRDNPSREPIEDDTYEYAPRNGTERDDWRHDRQTWAIADFFEVLKDQFRTLQFVPISPYTVSGVYYLWTQQLEDMLSMVREIYQEHGWPDPDRYRKRECLDAIQKALEEKYPDEADFVRD
ncbi:uncharacterized protein GGS25DRAFT_322664 [Hypoxylon fragiforme]|uniref:uncharacterized protein n=1 Tax=Hypoxylon fragiforme TaxID=63214 RepID=UPI0020C636FC|nr:uncharacterized protein GGS25DRAFT_322664 [Hypoxylon fragiforme]KAI2607197.1 hypothetical protein GGS25DRAFT_322664 [Hypoxylon fragiforme]